MSAISQFQVGTRVCDQEGFKATVKYIGPVAGAKNKTEIWLGVEWDIPSRGKHDGSSVDECGTVFRYFSCQSGAGSFIKPSKVDLGRPLIDALMDRYVRPDAPQIADSDTTLPDAFVNTLKGNQKTIEFVGEEKIRKRQQIENVRAVAVRNDTVSSVGADVGPVVGHLLEVDLQDNMIWQWKEVALLGSQVPQLQVLLLHKNRLQPLTKDIIASSFPSSRDCFSHLRVLALNSCGLRGWAEVQLLDDFVPALEELYLSGNPLADLPRRQAALQTEAATGQPPSTDSVAEVSGFGRLRLLDLSGCGLQEWSEVEAFGWLPGLQELLLDSTPELTHVLPPQPSKARAGKVAGKADTGDGGIGRGDSKSDEGGGEAFANLRRFSLSSTGLSSWFDVDMLACYPSLRALRLSQVPLFVGKGSSEVRPEAIARIPQLQFFNGSEVRQRERAEAEKSYLRDIIFDQQQDAVYPASLLPPGEIEGATAAGSISPALAAAALKQQIILQQQGGGEGEAEADTVPGVLLHPRYVALMDRYGADMVPSSRTASSGPANLASELVSVTFRNLSFGGNGTLEPITKKLPRSLTVQRLRLVVKQLFGLEPRQQDLSLRLFKDGPPSLLDDDGSSLHYYGVAEGAEIFVNDAKA